MQKPGGATEPLWYKDAIIYELHVKAFFDGNNDGIGDFQGLMQKLDYLQDLGVTCIWLLPFFASPLRDDGYDIADYLSVHPSYGTMEDFQVFLTAAHERGLQVLIELVINHTSDQHPWFQRARQSPPGSPERDFYVWSDTDQKYKDARIIFTDTEKSNWTWDPVAQAYFWHRFFSHQPDLNFDNPVVLAEVMNVMRYWLDLGVDGVRLDAIPYLVERDGTNCENLPETHVLIKKIRAEMDANYANRMILAEANQWPADVRPYFGEGDECHMAFHFPLMPRIFMALRLEDRLPITEIMEQTPDIPETSQWGLFLRNHDELTLEMVSADERDYMYLAYSADPRMRINIGIRRRLAPLMDNNRRRIELLSSLLFSFPGTPIIYYGDEIGMGDNIYLGDRNGVRTPMQWSPDRNAGFSRANPARLYSPVIMDPVYGYEAVNVEAEHSDPSSLLNWMRNLIALRKLFRVFGRGTLDFLEPANRKILAYLRQFENEQVLCVANLSRFAQPVELDLAQFEGMKPVEMIGYVEFPTIGKSPYPLTLGPYGFLWFELQKSAESVAPPASDSLEDQVALDVSRGWAPLLTGPARRALESRIIPDYLTKQRWFVEKDATIQAATIADWAEVQPRSAIALLDVRFEDDKVQRYTLPLAISFGDAAGQLRANTPQAILCPVAGPDGEGVLHDGTLDLDTDAWLLACIENRIEVPARRGKLSGSPGAAFGEIRSQSDALLTPTPGPSAPGVSTIVYDERFITKLYRRVEAGPNPDCELLRYLTEQAHFDRAVPYAGVIEYAFNGTEAATLAMLQGLVPRESDGWQWTTEELNRYFEHHAPISFPRSESPKESWFDLSESETPALAREDLGILLDAVSTLGRRTAEMHLALGRDTDDPAFKPQPMRPEDMRQLAGRLRSNASGIFDHLKEKLPALSDDVVEDAGLALSRRRYFLDRFRALANLDVSIICTRIHGNYHLARVLRVKNDWVILEADTCLQPAAERRAKQSPLKDVACLLRSLSYATYAALLNYAARHPEDVEKLRPWAQLAERSAVAEFLRTYRTTCGQAPFIPSDPAAFRMLLEAYMLDKVLDELRHEFENRQAWVRIPLWGMLALSQ